MLRRRRVFRRGWRGWVVEEMGGGGEKVGGGVFRRRGWVVEEEMGGEVRR